MAPVLPKNELRPQDETLQKIYESGQFSDLTVVTAAKKFSVHKAIICPACPFFEAACTRDFKEAHTNTINLPEDADVVEGLLRHCYGCPNIVKWDDDHNVQLQRGGYLTKLYIAADKYGLPALRISTSNSMLSHIISNSSIPLVGFGCYLFEQEDGLIEPWLLQMVVLETASFLPDQDEEEHEQVIKSLIASPAYMTAVLGAVCDAEKWNPVRMELQKKRAVMAKAWWAANDYKV